MLEHRQATDGRNPFCACPLKIQWGRLRRFTFYFLRAPGCQSSAPTRPYREKQAFFFLVAVTNTRLMWVKYEFKTLILFEGLKL